MSKKSYKRQRKLTESVIFAIIIYDILIVCSALIASEMNRRWICSDVWLDILPTFNRRQLGLTLALLSDRFDLLVDAHFDGKKELTIWNSITIRKDIEMPKLFVEDKCEGFPFPDHPLPNKIRFKEIWIKHIDYSVIIFLRSNQQIWERMGTKLDLSIGNALPIWDVLASEIWPAFATNIRHLNFDDAKHLDILRRLISPTILTDLKHLNAINSGDLCPDAIAADDGPNPISAGQALAKWLHTPSKNGQPKRLSYCALTASTNFEWVNNFKEVFVRARTSVSYTIQFIFIDSTQIVPFELENERTKEKLTLKEQYVAGSFRWWIMERRCPIIDKTAAVQQQQKNDGNSDANLNIVFFIFDGLQNALGPLSPPADKSDENVCSSGAGPSSDQRNE